MEKVDAPVSEPVQTPGQGALSIASDGQPVLSHDGKPVALELFSPDCFAPRADLVKMVKEKSYLHTGVLLTKDEELCRGVCADLLLGLSDRQIARKWRISRNSIIGIEIAMRDRGELEPLRKAISGELGEVILMGLRNYKDALSANTINPAQLPIPMAALIDKKGQIDGGVVPGTDLREAEITPEQLREQWEQMKRVKVIEVPPAESQSIGEPTKTA